jgi:hypothetical protein
MALTKVNTDLLADGGKLNGIEAGADVTDTTNVTAAGALMDSELTSITSVKALNQGVATTDSPTFAGLNASGNLTLDVAGNIILDADGGEIEFKDGGTTFGNIAKSSNDMRINQGIQDGDIVFRGNDGGSIITALTLDMSAAGAATFNSSVNTNSDVVIAKSATGVPSLTLSGFAGANSPYGIINFYNEDGSQQGPNNAAQIKALAINTDGSGGSLDFHTSTGTGTGGADATKKLTIGGGGAFTTYPSAGQPTRFNEDGNDSDFRVESDGNANMLFVDGGANKVYVGAASAGANGVLQVTGGIGLTGSSEIRQSTNADDGSTLRFLGTQLVIANSNANGYGYSGGGFVAAISPSAGSITLDVGANNTSGHRLKVINGSDGVAGSLQYLSGTTVQFKIDSLTGAIVTGNTTTRSITVSAGANATTLVELSGDGYQLAANVTLHTSRAGGDHGMYQYFLTNYYGQDRSTTLVASSGTATANLAITMQYDFLGNNMSSKIRLVNTGASCEVIVYMTNPV